MKRAILIISVLLGVLISGMQLTDIDSYYFVYPDSEEYPSISSALDSARAYNDSMPVIMIFAPVLPKETVIITNGFLSVSIIGQSAYGSMNTLLSGTVIMDSSSCVLQLEKLMSFNYKNHAGIRNSKVFITDCFIDNVYNRGMIDWEIFNSTIATDSTIGQMSSYNGFCTYVYFTDTTWKFQSKAMANCIYNNGKTDSLIFIIQNEDMSFFYDAYYDRYTMTAHNDTLTFEDGILNVGNIKQNNIPPYISLINSNPIVPQTSQWQSVSFDSIDMPETINEYLIIDNEESNIVIIRDCMLSIDMHMPYAAVEGMKIPLYMGIKINGKSIIDDIEISSNEGVLALSGTIQAGKGDTLTAEYYVKSDGIVFISPDEMENRYSVLMHILITD